MVPAAGLLWLELNSILTAIERLVRTDYVLTIWDYAHTNWPPELTDCVSNSVIWLSKQVVLWRFLSDELVTMLAIT
jgi:hypothetical protein